MTVDYGDHEGAELMDGYSGQARCTGARGLPLIPWLNRIRDGGCALAGTRCQVPLTGPGRNNAIHGGDGLRTQCLPYRRGADPTRARPVDQSGRAAPISRTGRH